MAPATTYKPRAGSLPDRVLAHFAAHPDVTHLTQAQICQLFDVHSGEVYKLLQAPVKAGVLRRDVLADSGSRGSVYLRGNAAEVCHGRG